LFELLFFLFFIKQHPIRISINFFHALHGYLAFSFSSLQRYASNRPSFFFTSIMSIPHS